MKNRLLVLLIEIIMILNLALAHKQLPNLCLDDSDTPIVITIEDSKS